LSWNALLSFNGSVVRTQQKIQLQVQSDANNQPYLNSGLPVAIPVAINTSRAHIIHTFKALNTNKTHHVCGHLSQPIVAQQLKFGVLKVLQVSTKYNNTNYKNNGRKIPETECDL